MADMLSCLHDEEIYRRNRGETRVIINALTYEWTPDIEGKIRNIPQQQKEDKRVINLKKKITRNEEEQKRFTIINDTLYHVNGNEHRLYVPVETAKVLIK